MTTHTMAAKKCVAPEFNPHIPQVGLRTMSIAAAAQNPVFPSELTTSERNIVDMALGLLEVKRLRRMQTLEHTQDLIQYLCLRFAGLSNEQLHVLYLDFDHKLISAELESVGNQSGVRSDLRQIVFRAITLGAEYVVFAHNHPTGANTPSEGDLGHLAHCERVLDPLGIKVQDSYVVLSSGIVSIKDYRERRQEEKNQKLLEEIRREQAERSAKRATTKAAKRAAAQGV